MVAPPNAIDAVVAVSLKHVEINQLRAILWELSGVNGGDSFNQTIRECMIELERRTKE